MECGARDKPESLAWGRKINRAAIVVTVSSFGHGPLGGGACCFWLTSCCTPWRPWFSFQ